ncbi:hypothetical protein [Paenibacillus assamensis]|uniref:hypothetical protein n=1 Tax=Paenibacillus assamensis TaxID=311244 RepID=UPI00041B74A0|nr:hypothetical protein [Paenibacillus assamensis]
MGREFENHHKKSKKRKHGNGHGNGHGRKKLIDTRVKKSAKKIIKVIEKKVFTVKKVKKFKVNLGTRSHGGSSYGGGSYGGGKSYGGGHKKKHKKRRSDCHHKVYGGEY